MEQGAGSREQGAGSREQGAWSREQGAGSVGHPPGGGQAEQGAEQMNKRTFEQKNSEFREMISGLDSPVRIQEYLDSIPYNTTKRTLSPLLVAREHMAHCMDGGMFAAAALRHLGYPPLLVDLAAENDDDHIIAVFREGKCWGALAKSNTTVLRFREPVYRSLRELAMSYFDLYYNLNGQKTLRSYSRTVDLSRFDDRNWETTEEDLEFVGDYMGSVRHYQLLTSGQAATLSNVPKYLFDAGFAGADIDGLFKPE